jgi:hypothetical protein
MPSFVCLDQDLGGKGPPMLSRMKHAVVRGCAAVGHKLTRLSHPRLAVQESRRPPVGVPPVVAPDERPAPAQQPPAISPFAQIEEVLKLIKPWAGEVPAGYVVDFLGILTDGKFLRTTAGPFTGGHVTTTLPTVATHGERWFEVADWLASAYEAREHYVAVSLGAAYGAQLVGAWKALQAINPLPSRLVAVEPVAENCAWIRSHMITNGINAGDHWIIQAAMGCDNEPILFPVAEAGVSGNNCVATNSAQVRRIYLDTLRRDAECERVLENIFLYNSTGIVRDVGDGFRGEVKFVSAVTLQDVLGPLDRVDLLEVDIQESEVNVFPPYMPLVDRKVRRVHIGTHGGQVHDMIRALFAKSGWEIVFDYAPDARYLTERGPLDVSDGVLTARNPQV